MRQHHEKRAEQELIGERVHVLTERRPLAEPAGQKAVQAIGDTRNHKERKCSLIVIVQNLDHEKRKNKQSQKGEQIGRSSKLGEKWHGR